MTRKLKFRYFLLFDKQFVYWDLKNSNHPTPDTFGYYGGISEPQQFTGLKDKNNKEIYEGDILYSIDDFADDKHSAIFTVVYDEYTWVFRMKGDHKGGHSWLEINKDCEIIGNIFENPELLKT